MIYFALFSVAVFLLIILVIFLNKSFGFEFECHQIDQKRTSPYVLKNVGSYHKTYSTKRKRRGFFPLLLKERRKENDLFVFWPFGQVPTVLLEEAEGKTLNNNAANAGR